MDPFEMPPFDPATAPAPDRSLEDALENVRAAAAVKVAPWQAIVAALGSARPASIDSTIDWLHRHRRALTTAYDEESRRPLALARLAPDLQYEPELGGLDRARDDHLLRGRHLFADLVDRRSLMQTMILGVSGIEISDEDAALIEQLGVANFAVDRRAWPLAVTRRVAGHGADFATAVLAGHAMMASPMIGASAGARAAAFLRFVDGELARGASLGEVIDGVLARREVIMGFGRPVVGPDERVRPVREQLERRGRDRLRFVTLLRAVEAELGARKGLQSNVAAWVGAALSDFGLSPDAVQAVASFYLVGTVYAQAVYARERAAPAGT